MAEFEVLIERILKVEKHPNADRLSINTIRGYQCISANLDDGSPRYKEGDLVIYVPEDTIVPEYLLRKGWWDKDKNKGMLSGKNGDRVKAIKLRGILSQGILYAVNIYDNYDPEEHFCFMDHFSDAKEGQNVAELLGFKKYEPPLPTQLAGEVVYIGSQYVPKFDIENLKKWPNLFNGLDVIVTEKLHGTCFISGYIPGLNNSEIIDNDFFVISK